MVRHPTVRSARAAALVLAAWLAAPLSQFLMGDVRLSTTHASAATAALDTVQ